MHISEFKLEFSQYLNRAVDQKLNTYNEYTNDSEILDIIQYTKNIVGGGKNIRPYMAFQMYKALGGDNHDEIMDLLVSIEIFHTFALIHDDVIDNGDTRHNNLTLHNYVKQSLIKNNRVAKDFEHIGSSQAILVGDILLAWSMERFQNFVHLPYFKEAWGTFVTMIDEVVVGQMIDVDIMTRDKVDTNLIETKMKLKTAGYTFVKPMLIGASLAGKLYEMEGFCNEFGNSIGVAFQIQDDLFDIVADPNIIKKSILSDIKDHQHTYLTQYIFENSSEDQTLELKSFWGRDISDSDQAKIINLFEKTGAIVYAKEMISSYLARAKQSFLQEEHLSKEGQLELETLIKYIQNRNY